MLQALCVLYKVNILLVRNHSYLDFSYHPENKVFIIEENQMNKSCKINPTGVDINSMKISDIKSKLWLQENIDNPLKSSISKLSICKGSSLVGAVGSFTYNFV